MVFIPKVESQVYVNFVKSHSCAKCNAPPPSEPHHVRGLDGLPGVGRRPSDHLAIPLCDKCHKLHQAYGEGTLSETEILKRIIWLLSKWITVRTTVGGLSYAKKLFI